LWRAGDEEVSMWIAQVALDVGRTWMKAL